MMPDFFSDVADLCILAANGAGKACPAVAGEEQIDPPDFIDEADPVDLPKLRKTKCGSEYTCVVHGEAFVLSRGTFSSVCGPGFFC